MPTTTPAVPAVSICPLITLPSIRLNGRKQTVTHVMNNIYVMTARGTATTGWTVSVAMTRTPTNFIVGRTNNVTCATVVGFCASNIGVHAANSHAHIPASDFHLLSGYSCTPAATNSNPTPTVTTPAGTVALTAPQVLCSAKRGTSGGIFTVGGGTFKLTIPSTVYHGKYYGTVVYSVVAS
jgi:hypothetical protein